MAWYFSFFGLRWADHWPPQHLRHGSAFGANIAVADYFRLMHDLTRRQWVEDLARIESARTQAISGIRARYSMAGRGPTADEMYGWQAQQAFDEFCRTSTNGMGNADLSVVPSASPGPPPASSNAPAGGLHR